MFVMHNTFLMYWNPILRFCLLTNIEKWKKNSGICVGNGEKF